MKTMIIIRNFLIPMIAVVSLFSSCTAPVNLNYESARMLNKGQAEVQGGVSTYSMENQSINTNYGGKLGFGITNRYNLKLRFEAIVPPKSHLYNEFSWTYFEIDNKISLNENLALSLPICFYASEDGDGYSVFDPRLYITMRHENTFEFTIMPKCHVFLGDGIAPMPGISLGLGLSSDLNKWSLRPEIGYDTYFSAGVGLSIFLEGK